jgi:hypothetical protein
MVPLLLCCVTPQDQQKVKGETKKEKGREPAIVIAVFHIMTTVGESSQKLINTSSVRK